MLKLSEMYIDQQVYWTDPSEVHGDPDHSSGVYMIAFINSGEDNDDTDDDILVLLRNIHGSEAEVFNSELSDVDITEHDLFECVDCKAVNDIEDSHGEHKTGLRCEKCNELTQAK